MATNSTLKCTKVAVTLISGDTDLKFGLMIDETDPQHNLWVLTLNFCHYLLRLNSVSIISHESLDRF